MKKLLLSIAITFSFLTCKQLECCTVIDTYADISVVDKNNGKDLLNPATENYYDIKKVTLEFSTYPNQKTSIDAIKVSKPLFFQKGDKYYLRVFPTTVEPMGNMHTVTIYWNDADRDKITFYLNKNNGNTLTEKILVNDELKWEKSNGYREITISK